jgi:N-acyl-D-amino-acid deacylase
MIDEAIAEGLDISLDAYPYTAASTTTLTAIPPKYLDKGAVAFAKSLEDPAVVEAIRKEIYEINDPSWDNSMYYVGLENFLIVRADETPWVIGKTYAEAAKEMGLEPFYGCMELLRRNKGNVRECRFSMCEENVETILKHPRCMVGSDGTIRKFDVINHPRGTGTFPRYLGRYIREREILSREEGIHRITGMPATRYKLKNKGFIRPGYDADLTLFDFDKIIDHADYVNPFLHNEGIHQVYVGGVLTLENDEPTGNWNGSYIR